MPSREPATNDAWTRVCGEAELPPGAATTAFVRGEQVALFNIRGEFYAMEARCPHANAPLDIEGDISHMTLTCTRHGSQFDLAHDCAVLRGPAARSPVVYAVKVDGGAIYVGASRHESARA